MNWTEDNSTGRTQRIKILEVMLITLTGGFILYFGRPVLIPVSFSLLISGLLFPLVHRLEQKGLSRSLSISLVMFFVLGLLTGILFILFRALGSFATDWAGLSAQLEHTIQAFSHYLLDRFNIELASQQRWVNSLTTNLFPQLFSLIRSTSESLYLAVLYFVLIPLMAFLILYHRHNLLAGLIRLFPGENAITIKDILLGTVRAYYNFIKGMLLVYLIVGILNSAGLLLLGIPHAILFGFLASVLTFIPYVGIMIASLLPISVSWITFGSWWYPAGVIAVFAVVQYLESNLIFPFAVSNQLKLNTLAILIAILLGGLLWGTAGMILFIPFTGILKLIADRSEKLKALSLFLGT